MSILVDSAARFRWPAGLSWPGQREMTLEEAMGRAEVPGVSAAVIVGGAVAETEGWGLACADEAELVSERTLFQAASISKPVAAACAMRLVADGQLDLDQHVNAYLRSWRLPGNDGWQPHVTLRMLLSHTAGLTVHGFPGYRAGALLPTLIQVLEGRGNTLPVRVGSLPGVQFSYSGGGYCVLQQLLQDVTGVPFGPLAAELVLGPAGMTDSIFEHPLAPSRHGLAATGHRSGAAPVAGRWHIYPELAAAGLWTTPADLAAFAIAIQQSLAGAAGALLPPRLAALMCEPAAPNAEHGLGLEGERGAGPGLRFGHSGGNEGFTCKLTALITGGAGAAVMTNSDLGFFVAMGLIETIGVTCGWPASRPADPPAVPAGRYAGAGVSIEVPAGGGELTLHAAGQPPLPLRPDGPGRWTAAALNLHVTAGADGGQVRLVVHQDAEYTTDITALPQA